MLAIDFKNVFMYEHGNDMTCKLCDKIVSRNFSCSYRGVNCICDDCRFKLSEIFNEEPEEVMHHIISSGEDHVHNELYGDDLFKDNLIRKEV